MILQKFLPSKYCLTIGPINVKESDHVELLGITIDKHLDFKKHIKSLCWNANYRVHALRRLTTNLAVENANLLGNAFIDSQSNSAPLIWCSVRRLFILRLERYIIRRLELITSQMPLIAIF